MSSDFTGSLGDDSARLGRSSRLSSQRFDSSRFESFLFAESEWMRNSDEEFPPHGGGYISPPPLTKVISESGDLAGNAPVLATPVDDGFALREWRRKNTIRLEEKERKEKEMLKAIIEEADEYKAEQLKKWKIRCENNRAINREKEKMFIEGREKFHLEADQSYWKAIAEIIPKEVPIIEKKGKKDHKGGIVVIHGPKPGKPTDLSRMRRILLQLKNAPPRHMTSPPLPLPKNQGVPTIAN